MRIRLWSGDKNNIFNLHVKNHKLKSELRVIYKYLNMNNLNSHPYLKKSEWW
jgi:hypothetical protein